MLSTTNHDEVDPSVWTPWGIDAVQAVAAVEIGSPFPTDAEKFAAALREARYGPLPEVEMPRGAFVSYRYDDQYRLSVDVTEDKYWEQSRIRVVGEKKLIVGPDWKPKTRED